MIAIKCDIDKTPKRSKEVKEHISENTELIIQRRGYGYRAIIKDTNTNEMSFSNIYDSISGLNRYFLANYDIKLL